MWALTLVLLIIYIPLFALLIGYGVNLYFMIIITLWRRKRLKALPITNLPVVTVQVPLFNERYVSQRVIDAVVALDYPSDKLQIQILDDSTDDTREIVAAQVAAWQARGVRIEHIHRTDRSGYKAGALAAAMPQVEGDFIAIFDADFLPSPDFLMETLPLLLNDPKAAFVQARWEHLNLNASWLTRLQAVAIDSHFMIEQYARSRGGFAFNFNGTAGIWRRSAIIDAGGWKDHTLTEDLDLSYRAWLRGWHGLYRDDVASPAELPPTMTAFRRQQERWQRGSIECARLLLPDIWRSRYPLLAKIQATIHLLGPLVTPTMAFLMISYPFLNELVRRVPGLIMPLSLIDYIGPVTIAPTLFFIMSQVLVGRRHWRAFAAVILCQVIGAGMAMNTLRAVIKAALGQRGEFLRTPKWGSAGTQRSTYRLRADMGVLADLMWGVYCLLLVVIGLMNGHTFIAVYGVMSWFGSWWVALWTIYPDLQAALRSKSATAA